MLLYSLLARTLVLPAASAQSNTSLNLWPLPQSYDVGSTVVCLSSDFCVEFDCDASDDLRAAADRMVSSIRKSTHTYLSVQRGQEFFSGKVANGCASEISKLVVSVDDGDSVLAHATRPIGERDETYNLTLPVQGEARVSAATALGAFRGLTTFENIWYKTTSDITNVDSACDEGITYAPFTPYNIQDAPAFPWRSVLLDTSRNWFSIDALKRQLDAMAKVKFSVFQWHITDAQSWPLELSKFPELAETGAYSPSRKYSEDEVRDLIKYAGERGIDVVIEIDTPGHTSVIGYSHPDYIACFEAEPWGLSANEPPAGQLRFADAGVTNWTASLFEAISDLTSSAYFGTGGDELNANCMAEDVPTQQNLNATGRTLEDALRDFTKTTHDALIAKDRTPVVWEEMVLAHGNLQLNNDTVVAVWISSANSRAVLDQGFRVVHAPSDYFYLDCGLGGWVAKDGGGNSWCDPFKSWALMYSFNPYDNVTDTQHSQVLGGQASLWAEQTDETNYETVMWPRAAAVAELFWTGAGDEGYPRSAVKAMPRMHDIRFRLVDTGIRAEPLQPEWCALRPGKCNA